MRWSPILHAVGAIIYIGVIVRLMEFIQSLFSDTPDTVLVGMGMLSLFVFSAAVMAFLFFYQPVVLLSENKKKEALSYFLKTLGAFGVITVCVFILISLR